MTRASVPKTTSSRKLRHCPVVVTSTVEANCDRGDAVREAVGEAVEVGEGSTPSESVAEGEEEEVCEDEGVAVCVWVAVLVGVGANSV